MYCNARGNTRDRRVHPDADGARPEGVWGLKVPHIVPQGTGHSTLGS